MFCDAFFRVFFWRCGDKVPVFADNVKFAPLHFGNQCLEILVKFDLFGSARTVRVTKKISDHVSDVPERLYTCRAFADYIFNGDARSRSNENMLFKY